MQWEGIDGCLLVELCTSVLAFIYQARMPSKQLLRTLSWERNEWTRVESYIPNCLFRALIIKSGCISNNFIHIETTKAISMLYSSIQELQNIWSGLPIGIYSKCVSTIKPTSPTNTVTHTILASNRIFANITTPTPLSPYSYTHIYDCTVYVHDYDNNLQVIWQ